MGGCGLGIERHGSRADACRSQAHWPPLTLPMAGTTRLWFRERALADVEAAAQWYAREAGVDVADAFVAALEAAYARIARNPGIGSPRWAHAVGMAGLRSLPVGRFPWLVFYVELEDRIEIWRVLHGARDMPALLAEPEPGG